MPLSQVTLSQMVLSQVTICRPIPISPDLNLSFTFNCLCSDGIHFFFMEVMFLLKYFVSMLASFVVSINDS